MIDIIKVERDAQALIADEQASVATKKIVGKLREIAAAERIVMNLRLEYETLKRDIGADA